MPVPLACLVVLLVAAATIRGWRRGGVALLVRVAAGLGGLVAGLWAARLLSASLSPVWHVLLGLACAIGGVLVGATVGRHLVAPRTARPGLPDRVLGMAVRGGGTLVVCGLVLNLLASFVDGVPGVPIAGRTWAAAAGVLDAAAPQDVAALVPVAAAGRSAKPSADQSRVGDAVAGSVFEIAADRCDGDVVGTGFVAANHLVVTNAHVIEGARSVHVGSSDATVVAISRRADLAVLRVSRLDAAPLTLASEDAENGSSLTVVGYPEGGPRTVVGATVLQRLPLPNPGLAGGLTLHLSYRLHTSIKHGNSGSPLLDTSGRVVGVVNAIAAGDGAGTTGYAVSIDELRPVLAAADTATAPVATGDCTE